MSNDNELSLTWKPGTNGHGILSARINGHGPAIYTAKLDSTNPDQRADFLAKLFRKKRMGPSDRQTVEEKLEEIAASCLGGNDAEMEKLSQGQSVAKLADGAELFHCGQTAYATVSTSDGQGNMHPETYPVNSKEFELWLGARFYRAFGRPATSAAVNDATSALAGKAIFQGAEKQIAVRIAEHGGAIYLDLGDEAWRAVRITQSGWTIVKDSPIKFLRRRGMMPLPTPVRGGSIERLRPLLNVQEERHWVLMVSWLLGALHPRGPYPVMCVNGEHGSAKSTATRMLRMLVDPNKAMTRSLPRDDRDLYIQASNSWICAYDNISGMRRWVSDALCCLATGGGFGTRMLHTDDSEILFNVKRPIILNGIEEDVARMEDLADRAMQVVLSRIAPEDRCTEEDVWREFEDGAPEVLGALLDAASCALANVASVKLDRLPRMADFAKWVVAAESTLGWKAGAFMEAYARNRDEANSSAIEHSPIGLALALLMENCSGGWTGTLSELLESVARCADDATKRRDDWPSSARRLSTMLDRMAPVLREKGIEYARGEKNKIGRTVTLSGRLKSCADSVTFVTSSPDPPFFG